MLPGRRGQVADPCCVQGRDEAVHAGDLVDGADEDAGDGGGVHGEGCQECGHRVSCVLQRLAAAGDEGRGPDCQQSVMGVNEPAATTPYGLDRGSEKAEHPDR